MHCGAITPAGSIAAAGKKVEADRVHPADITVHPRSLRRCREFD
jgi:hypothetical protein